MTLIHSLDIISSCSFALPFVLGVLLFFKVSTPVKYFYGFIAANSVVQIALHILANNGHENIWLINVSALTDLLFIFYFINSIYFKLSFKRSITISAITIFIFFLTNTNYGWDTIVKLTFLGSEFITLILVLSALIYCIKNFNIMSQYLYLILIPLSIYLASVILVFLAYDLAVESKNENLFIFYQYLFPIINIAAYSCYAIAFYLDARPKLNSRN